MAAEAAMFFGTMRDGASNLWDRTVAAGHNESAGDTAWRMLQGANPGVSADAVGIGMAAGAIFGTIKSVGTGAKDLVTVGRWMSVAEHAEMVNTGRMVESSLNGVSSISVPASAVAYANAAAGSVYAEFKIAADAIRAAAGGWGKVWGPNSIFGAKLGITEMPAASNIVIKATKP